MAKITIDTKNNELKVGRKAFNELDDSKKREVETVLINFIKDNTKLSDYEEDCMWMSYRYCVGRKTIASHLHAFNIFKNCYGRMSNDRQLFTAFDINREIEQQMNFMKPHFNFPRTQLNRLYGFTAVDIVCDFIEEYNIKSTDDFIKYKDIDVILTDNERGYKFETVTWEEWLRPKVCEIVSKYYDNDAMSEDFAWKYFETWRSGVKMNQEEMVELFEKLTRDMPNPEYYYMYDFEDLFAWSNLAHAFDNESHHKSLLVDGTEIEWFWSYANKTEKQEDGFYHNVFGYEKVRRPIDTWNARIPDDVIKENLY